MIAFSSRVPHGWRASLEGGSFGYARATVGAGLQNERFEGGVIAAGWRADGISAADQRDGNGESDGGWSYTLAARGRLILADRVSVFGQVRRLETRSDTDGYPPPNYTFADTLETARNTIWFGQAGLDAQVFGVAHQATYAVYDIDRANLGGDFPSAFTARRQIGRYTASYGAPGDRFGLQGGLEYEDDRATLSDGTGLNIANASAFLVARINPTGALSLTGSVRYDDPSNFAGVVTGRLAGVWRVGGGFSLTSAWGQGFKTPTISQLACDYCFPGGRSTGLRPEHAKGYELGLRWSGMGGRTSAQLTAFHLDVTDQIDFASSFPFRYANLKQTRSDGIEASLEQQLSETWQLRAAYTHTVARNLDTGAALLRVPRDSGSISLSYLGRDVSAIATVRAQGPQADAGGQRPGFVVVNLAGQYQISRQIALTARVENLTNTHYQEVLGYGEPGISAFIGVRLTGN